MNFSDILFHDDLGIHISKYVLSVKVCWVLSGYTKLQYTHEIFAKYERNIQNYFKVLDAKVVKFKQI